ncbi:c-type cytochrome [Echinicola marina]|uniref:c-type cytochrome n=1 Tax=Echinicola marina TaxID=2859768 RepID=UPI001CF69BDC|nr:c-type cytochrome [Echinicola marina]UCS95394.1 c-type cytochrome [Echinicola marina]
MKIIKSIYLVALSAASLGVVSCGASGDDQGLEYAPQMYHSVAYEPLTQIQNEEAGSWLSNREDGKGEFFNSNVHNPHNMNMREPVANTVARNQYDMLPYRLKVADLEGADAVENPIELTDQVLADGKRLFTQYCSPCHGASGQGDGKVGEVIGGVANLTGGAYINLTEGHIFHVITHGKGRMGAHGSQITPERRWKIVHYVKQEIQKQ